MTTEPYELLVRMTRGTSPGGASVRYLTTLNGREFESDPQPLADATDPVFIAFAAQFSAKTVAERDAAVAERDAAQSALTTVTAERDALRAEVERLTAELDAIRNPPVNPRMIHPLDFMNRLPLEVQVAIVAAGDSSPTARLWFLRLSASSLVDLDAVETQGAVASLVAAKIITQEQADTLLA